MLLGQQASGSLVLLYTRFTDFALQVCEFPHYYLDLMRLPGDKFFSGRSERMFPACPCSYSLPHHNIESEGKSDRRRLT